MSTSRETKLRLGTRGSRLAVQQSLWVADRLRSAADVDIQIVTISTNADESALPIELLGTTGVFVTALRQALLASQVDFLVHSCKDLPSQPAPGLYIAAIPEREDPRDALVGVGATDSLDQLCADARVGTGAPRRVMQLLAARRDLEPIPLRGNLETRLRKVQSGELVARN